MAVAGKNRHDHLATILRRHFNAAAARCGWGDDAEDIICELLSRVEGAIDTVLAALPPGFPGEVAEGIFQGVRAQARRLQDQPAS